MGILRTLAGEFQGLFPTTTTTTTTGGHGSVRLEAFKWVETIIGDVKNAIHGPYHARGILLSVQPVLCAQGDAITPGLCRRTHAADAPRLLGKAHPQLLIAIIMRLVA